VTVTDGDGRLVMAVVTDATVQAAA
jgi:hypothetical protein